MCRAKDTGWQKRTYFLKVGMAGSLGFIVKFDESVDFHFEWKKNEANFWHR